MKKGRSVVLVAVLALALMTAACGSKSSDNGGGGSPAGAGGSPSAGAGQTVSIKGFKFDPNALTVSAGTTQIAVTNHDGVTHTFTLDDGSVSTPIPAGQTVTVTVDISKTTGWHCSIHPTMTGTLNVA